MKYVNKIVSGLFYIGLSYAVGFGLVAVIYGIFDTKAALYARIILGVAAAAVFTLGFVAGGGDEPKKRASQAKEDARNRLKEQRRTEIEREAHDCIVLSALISLYERGGGELRGLLPRSEADALYAVCGLLDERFTAEEQLNMAAELIRKKSAEVLRIDEEDAT